MGDHPNVQVIRDGYAAFSRGDMDALSQLFTDDIQWHEAGGPTSPIAGDYKGKEAVFEMFGKLMTLTNGQFGVHLEEVTADDRQAVAMHTATGHNGQRTYHSREAIVFHLLDGRVTDAWHTVPDVAAYDEFWETGETLSGMDQVQRIRDGYEAFNRGDIAAVMETIDEDVVWHAAAGTPSSGTYRGRDAVLGYFARLAEEMPQGTTLRVLDVLTDGDRALVSLRAEGHTDDGPWKLDSFNLMTLRDGRITEYWAVDNDPEGDAETSVRLLGRTTPEAAIARVRRGYEAFATGDFAALDDFIDAGAVWNIPGNSRFAGTYTGRDQIYALFAEMVQGAGGDMSMELGMISSTGLVTTCEVRTTMAGHTFDAVHVLKTSADGLRAVGFWQIADPDVLAEIDALFPATG